MAGLPFTDDVRLALMRARDHAASRRNEYIGTEHILLGLLDETGGPVSTVFDRVGADRQAIRAMIDAIVRPGASAIADDRELPYTSRSKKVLELAMLAARLQRVDFVDTAHLLLGITDEQMGVGAQVLASHELTSDEVRPVVDELRRSGPG